MRLTFQTTCWAYNLDESGKEAEIYSHDVTLPRVLKGSGCLSRSDWLQRSRVQLAREIYNQQNNLSTTSVPAELSQHYRVFPFSSPEAVPILASIKNRLPWRQRPRSFWTAPRMASSSNRGRASFGQHHEWSTSGRQRPRFFWSAPRMATSGVRGRSCFGQHQTRAPQAPEVTFLFWSAPRKATSGARSRVSFGRLFWPLVLVSTKQGRLWRRRPRFFSSATRKATPGARGRASFGQHQERPPLSPEATLRLVSTKKGHFWRQRPRFFWSTLRITASGGRGRVSFGPH